MYNSSKTNNATIHTKPKYGKHYPKKSKEQLWGKEKRSKKSNTVAMRREKRRGMMPTVDRKREEDRDRKWPQAG